MGRGAVIKRRPFDQAAGSTSLSLSPKSIRSARRSRPSPKRDQRWLSAPAYAQPKRAQTEGLSRAKCRWTVPANIPWADVSVFQLHLESPHRSRLSHKSMTEDGSRPRESSLGASNGRGHFALDVSRQLSGGGLQIAARTLDGLEENFAAARGWKGFVAIVPQGTPLEEVARRKLGERRVLTIPSSPIGRMACRAWHLPLFLRKYKVGHLYTLFGPPPLFSGVRTLAGCAYGNILEGDRSFWPRRPFRKYLLHRVIDAGRIWGIRRADIVLVETEHLQRSAPAALGIPAHAVRIIPPPSPAFRPSSATRPSDYDRSQFPVLFLTSTNPNKGLAQMVEALVALEARYPESGVVVGVSLNEADVPGDLLSSLCQRAAGRVRFLGRVDSQSLWPTWSDHQAALCLSRLESFTNVVLEAFASATPLVITDSSWAHDSCGPAALYVDRESGPDIAAALVRLEKDADLRCQLAGDGVEQLRTFPTATERLIRVLDIACEMA